jgi:DNA-binding NarL/FixJ family response regulator
LNSTLPCRAVLAEDHIFVRELIVNLAEMSSAFRIISQESTLDSAVQACRAKKADLLLLSIALLRHHHSGRVHLPNPSEAKHATLVYCSSGTTDAEIIRVIRSGVNGCIGAKSNVDELLHAIRHVCRGETYFCSLSAKILADIAIAGRSGAKSHGSLSKRETEILQLISDGHTSKQIARQLGLSIATVNTHRRNLMAKANAHNAADLIGYGRKHHLLEFRPH